MVKQTVDVLELYRKRKRTLFNIPYMFTCERNGMTQTQKCQKRTQETCGKLMFHMSCFYFIFLQMSSSEIHVVVLKR